MPCNSGVSLTPIVNGEEERFAARGLYNGLALLGDDTTRSYWDHITGACVHGKRKGMQLPFSDFDLLYTTVAAALQSHPQAALALSNQLLANRLHISVARTLISKITPKNFLPPHFTNTMQGEDPRRDRMDMGLGVWTDSIQRYYPMDSIRAHPAGLLDTLDGRRLFVHYSNLANAPAAFYVTARSVHAEDDSLIFDTGDTLQDGRFYDTHGKLLKMERPQQMFTRWYGFAFTFPGCDIYQQETSVSRTP